MATNINTTRTTTNSREGGDLTSSDVQTIEFTEGGELLSETTETVGSQTVTHREYSSDITVRKENGEVRATITQK
mgnify:CR=1 FL=1